MRRGERTRTGLQFHRPLVFGDVCRRVPDRLNRCDRFNELTMMGRLDSYSKDAVHRQQCGTQHRNDGGVTG